jgi:hypothetical protein
MIETRIIGSRVELHAMHRPSGHRFITKADRLEDAAEALSDLIEGFGNAGGHCSDSPRPITLKLALAKALHRLKRFRGINIAACVR